MKNILIFTLVYIVGNTMGCRGGGGGTSPTNSSNLLGNTTKQEYWTPKPGVKAEWEAWHFKWTKDAKQKLKETQQNNGTDDDYYHVDPDSDVPGDWQGLGPGMDGQDPPPWAILKDEGGKPDFCLEQPSYGVCDQNQTRVLYCPEMQQAIVNLGSIFIGTRWGYNPFVKECQLFKYSGCGGNQNNFREKVQCVASCELTPRPNCAIYDD